MKLRIIKNAKGMELSINMLVIVALAIFALFLIIGFVIGGFGFFTGIFKEISGKDPVEVIKIKCDTSFTNWGSAGRPEIKVDDAWYKRLCAEKTDVDQNNDRQYTDADIYKCSDYVSVNCPS